MLYLNQLLYKELPYLHKTLQGGTMSTVSRSGCGLCSMSMVVDHLTMQSLPIEDCVKLSEDCGANRWTGTSIGVLGPVAAEKFGLDYAETNDPEEMLACLHGGGRVIVHIGGDREGHIGVFSHGGHYVAAISEAPDGRIVILDPSYKEGKFEEEGRKGLVEMKHGVFAYCDMEVLVADTANRDPGFHLFHRL